MRSSNVQKNTPETQLINLLRALLFGKTVECQCAGEGNVVTVVIRTHNAHVRGRQGF